MKNSLLRKKKVLAIPCCNLHLFMHPFDVIREGPRTRAVRAVQIFVPALPEAQLFSKYNARPAHCPENF